MQTAHNRASLATAKVIPILLALLVGYASYVITGPLVVEYLLNPPYSSVQQRVTAGIAILIVYYLLLLPVAVTWLRLLVIVWRSPGYVELGESADPPENQPAPGLEAIYEKDVFCCDSRGLPIWCRHCGNWKPDRAHHNQDVGRCTLKMDHFCPWVGGVVGERSFKFFVQFLFYSLLLSAYVMSCFAYFVAERVRKGIGQNVQWLVVLGIAGFFCLFTVGMVGNSLWMVLRNVTTIENLDHQNRTMFIAVALPPELQGTELSGPPITQKHSQSLEHTAPSSDHDVHPITSDIDHPSHSSYFNNLSQARKQRRSSTVDHIWHGTISFPLHLPVDRPPLPAPELRTFAILKTLPGMNIWNLGSAWLNFQTVFGSRPHEWLIPITHSPCCNHSSMISQYPLGPDFEELLIEVGLVTLHPENSSKGLGGMDIAQQSSVSHDRRRKRRLDAGWQNGERPDGWISEKEARRARNDLKRQYLVHGQRHDR